MTTIFHGSQNTVALQSNHLLLQAYIIVKVVVNERVYLLDLAAKLDETAHFLCSELWKGRGGEDVEFPDPLGIQKPPLQYWQSVAKGSLEHFISLSTNGGVVRLTDHLFHTNSRLSVLLLPPFNREEIIRAVDGSVSDPYRLV
ncbi:hypothetical protein PRIPAC_76036 [Pristionchus pacificus]|uniref:Uncharacterized protein n=1 Tax=Pristionchus pacificus TaxID=54126 RepID=A0A2A6B4K5_PRIPA|nr:hypothetical protein PRIPAC_76036 [Pristionchus pacificus]|eukprot:PDM60802.1 hypothetical protein PRIPAC_54608 [Pristionchus pacificus]